MTQININYLLSTVAPTGGEKPDSDVEAGPPGLFGELMGKKLGVKLDGQPSAAADGKGDGRNLEIEDGEAKEGEAVDGEIAPIAGAAADGGPATTLLANAVAAPIVSIVWMGPDPQTTLPESVADPEDGNAPVVGADENGGPVEDDAVEPSVSSDRKAIPWSWFQKGMPMPSPKTPTAAPVRGAGVSEGTAQNGGGTSVADPARSGASGSLPAGNVAAPALAQDPATGIRNPESGIRNPASGIRNPASGIRQPASGSAAMISAAQEQGSGGTASRIMPAGQTGEAGNSAQAQASAPGRSDAVARPASAAMPGPGLETGAIASQAVAGANAAATVAAGSGVSVVPMGNTMRAPARGAGGGDGIYRVEAPSKLKTVQPTGNFISFSGNAKAIETSEPLQTAEPAGPNPQAEANRSMAENRTGGNAPSGVSQGSGEATVTAELPAAAGHATTSARPASSPPGDRAVLTPGQTEETISVQGEEEDSIQTAEQSNATDAKSLQQTSGGGRGRLAVQKGRAFKSALTAAEAPVKTAPNGPAAGRAAGGEVPAIPTPDAGVRNTALENLGTAGAQPRHSSTVPESAPFFDAAPAAATVTSPASQATPPESARGLVMDRVMKLQELIDRFDQHAAAATAKDGSMTIKLIPDNLGKVSLNCREANGALQMQVVVENQTVRALLVQHETAIRHLLEQAGIQLSDFDVRTQQEGTGSRQLNGQGRSGFGGRHVEAVTTGELAAEAPETPAYWSREQTQMWIA